MSSTSSRLLTLIKLKRRDNACQFLDASFEVLPTNFGKDCHELLYYNPAHDQFKIPHHSSSISCHSSSHSCIYNFTPVKNAVITYFRRNPPSLADQVRKKNHAPYQARSISTEDFNNIPQTCAPTLELISETSSEPRKHMLEANELSRKFGFVSNLRSSNREAFLGSNS